MLALAGALSLGACEEPLGPGDSGDPSCNGKCDGLAVTGSLPAVVRSATWDGRIVFGSRNGDANECRAMAVRPSRVDRTGGGVSFGASVFSEGVQCPTGLAAHAVAATDLAQNPFPSDAAGTPTPGGDHLTYALQIVATDDEGRLSVRRGTAVLARPTTQDAEVVGLQWDDGAPLFDRDGETMLGLEPTMTADGGLLIFRDGDSETLVYSRREGDSWTAPRSLTELFTEGSVLVDGVALAARYPLAAAQLRGPDGRFLPAGTPYFGAHPWISQDGADLFHAATVAGNPERDGERGRHGAVSVIGQATGHGLRHLDGAINPSRDGMTEAITVSGRLLSPGRSLGAFAPYRAERTLPVERNAPTYPLFGSLADVAGTYNEVEFEVFSDRDYLVYLPMNENIATTGDFVIDTAHTPDISGHFNTATVQAGARFGLE